MTNNATSRPVNIDRAELIEALFRGLIDPHEQTFSREVEAPSPEELLPYIQEFMAELRDWFDRKVEDLFTTLEQRGKEYGEEVLIVMGERGMLEFANVKLHRLRGNMDQGKDIEDRRDSWIDVAGYSILPLAIAAWQKDRDARRDSVLELSERVPPQGG